MRNRERNAMRTVKMNKGELLTIVLENKEKHIKEFEEAVEDYKVVIINVAKQNLKLAKGGSVKNVKFFPSEPKSYEKDYQKAIRMLELSVEDVIEVEEDVFNQLVLDEWGWKDSFVMSNSTYKSML